MADDRFELLMKAWGRAYWQEPAEAAYERRTRIAHPIAQSMEFAPGKRSRQVIRKIIGRDGTSRRRIMARATGIEGFDMVPTGFAEPIRCKETPSIHYQPEALVPAELQRVEQAVRELEEFKLIRGLCVRMNYCLEGQHAEKALEATNRMRRISKGHKVISVDMFRDELLYGRIWIHGRVYSSAPPRIVTA
jgi:hypothetical protein